VGHGGGVRRRWLDLLFALYLAVVAFGVFGPSPGQSLDQAGQGARRSPSLIDIRWNSLGAVLGFSLWLVGRAVLRHRRLVAAA